MIKSKINRQLLSGIIVLVVAALPLSAGPLFKVDFSDGTAGQEIATTGDVVPTELPSNKVTSALPAGSVVLDAQGALPGQYALYTGRNYKRDAILLSWADESSGPAVKSGVLTASWTMKVTTPPAALDGVVSVQIIRPGLGKNDTKLARVSVNAVDGQIKMGGSTESGAASDAPISKTRLNVVESHTFVWTLDFASGVQTLSVDDGAAARYSSAARAELNFHNGSSAIGLKIVGPGAGSVVAFDNITVESGEEQKP